MLFEEGRRERRKDIGKEGEREIQRERGSEKKEKRGKGRRKEGRLVMIHYYKF